MVNEFLSENKIWIGVFLVILIFYLLSRRKKAPNEFEKEYSDILNSSKYKVKNQYEKS